MTVKKNIKSTKWIEFANKFSDKKLTNKAVSNPDEELHSILKKRASILAQNKGVKGNSIDFSAYLVFELSKQVYSFELESIVQICYPENIFSIPIENKLIKGVINIKGELANIIDLGAVLKVSTKEKNIPDSNAIIITKYDNDLVGFCVDKIKGIQKLPSSKKVKKVPKISTLPETFIKGVIINHFIILDVQQILSDQSLLVNDIIR